MTLWCRFQMLHHRCGCPSHVVSVHCRFHLGYGPAYRREPGSSTACRSWKRHCWSPHCCLLTVRSRGFPRSAHGHHCEAFVSPWSASELLPAQKRRDRQPGPASCRASLAFWFWDEPRPDLQVHVLPFGYEQFADAVGRGQADPEGQPCSFKIRLPGPALVGSRFCRPGAAAAKMSRSSLISFGERVLVPRWKDRSRHPQGSRLAKGCRIPFPAGWRYGCRSPPRRNISLEIMGGDDGEPIDSSIDHRSKRRARMWCSVTSFTGRVPMAGRNVSVEERDFRVVVLAL